MKKNEIIKELRSLELQDQILIGKMKWNDNLEEWYQMDNERYELQKKISILKSKLNKKKVI